MISAHEIAEDVGAESAFVEKRKRKRNSVNVTYVPCHWFSCFCFNVLDIIIQWSPFDRASVCRETRFLEQFQMTRNGSYLFLL